MHPDHAVDWTIRNQRCPGLSPWLLLGAWGLVWATGGLLLQRLTPRDWQVASAAAWLVAMLGSTVGFRVYLNRRPVQRLKLGESLRAYPWGRFEPAALASIRFSADPDEDYAEGKPPVRFCLVAIHCRRGRVLRLVASEGDAVRLRAWAERNRIAVFDPRGLSGPRGDAEPG